MSDELIKRLERVSLDLGIPSQTILDSAVIREAAAALAEAQAEIARLRSLIGRYGLQVGDAEGVDFTVGRHLTALESVEVSGLIDDAEILRRAALTSPPKDK